MSLSLHSDGVTGEVGKILAHQPLPEERRKEKKEGAYRTTRGGSDGEKEMKGRRERKRGRHE